MFDLIQWWLFRTSTNQPLRFSNRVVLSLENLEDRFLLSAGVTQTPAFDSPLSAVAIVAEPVNLNATSAQSQQTLSDVVPGGSARLIRAPIQTGTPSNGTTGSTGQPGVSTLAPLVNTTLDVVLPGVNAGQGPSPSPTPILPGQGTASGTRAGGQNLLPGGATTPPTPAQQVRAGIINTTDPYAAFEQTILTKEGEKTASGQEARTKEELPSAGGDKVPNPPQNKNQPKPVRASGTFEEQEELAPLDPNPASTDDQAARQRHKTDAFFMDGVLMTEDQGWAPGNAVALAGAMLILGGFWPGDRGRRSGHR